MQLETNALNHGPNGQARRLWFLRRIRFNMGKVALLTFSSAACPALCYLGWPAHDTPSRYSPLVCRAPHADFGKISQQRNEGFQHTFRLENVSRDPVQIAQILTDCGCVVASSNSTTITAHGHTDVPVTFRPAMKPGPFVKRIEVRIAGTHASAVHLSLGGVVGASAALYSVPERLHCGTAGSRDVGLRTLTIARYDASPVRFISAQPDSAAVQVVAVNDDDKADSLLKLTIALNPAAALDGPFRSSLTILTADCTSDKIAVPVIASIERPRSGLVRSLAIDRLPPSSHRDVSLFDPGSTPFSIRAVVFKGPSAISARLLTGGVDAADSGGEQVRVSRAIDGLGPAIVQGTLLLTTPLQSDPISIPIEVYLPD